jgi:hypothetical protein
MEVTELFQCPVCRQGRVLRSELEKKSLFGAKTVSQIACNQCGTVFSESPEGFSFQKKPTDKKALQQYHGLVARYYLKCLKAEEWGRIAQGGVSDKEQEEIDHKEREQKLFEKLGNGDLSGIPIQADVPLMMKPGEGAYVNLNGVQYVEERTRSTYVGGTRGVSFRLMKGVSFRTGGFKGERVPVTEKVELDRGRFVVTNKRVIFSGPRKNVSFPVSKILEVHEYTDGLSISREGKQKTEYYLGKFELPELKYHSVWELVNAVIHAVYQGS